MRLDCMTDGGVFLEEVKYQVGKKKFEVKEGARNLNTMHQWRAMRAKAGPEAFEKVEVWQHPTGWTDGILTEWLYQNVRDMFPDSPLVVRTYVTLRTYVRTYNRTYVRTPAPVQTQTPARARHCK
jgi:hypothetical protein